MPSPNMLDASKLSEKSRVVKGDKDKEALKKAPEIKKKRSQAEKRKAMYGDQDVKK